MLVISAPCAAGEDSSSGILSAHAGMRVVAMPNRAFTSLRNRPQDLRFCDPLCKICTKKS
jgi:hypothetical protein